MILTFAKSGETTAVDPHQLEAFYHLRENPRAALFLGMSLQKTATVLMYLSEMIYEEAAFSKTLIIAPPKVARLTWPDEIANFKEFNHIRYSLVDGTIKQRQKALEVDAEVYIISVDNLAWLIDLYIYQRKSKITGLPYGPWLGALPFDSVVIDELSMFKNRDSKRYAKLDRALTLSKIEYRIGLTGTPSPNGLVDLWAQLKLIDGGVRLGETFGRFVDKYFTTRGNGMIIFEYKPKPGAANTIAKKIADICLSMQTDDYVTLPPLTIFDKELDLEPFDREIYESLEREYALEFFEGGDVTVKTSADLINKLLQISSGSIYADREEDKAREWHKVNDLKLEALADIVETYPHENIIVVYQFQHEVARILERFPYAKTLGKGRKLKESFDAWNAGKIKMLLLHPASAGHGLNLQWGGRREVWTSPTWNLEHWLQTVARVRRRGALRPIFIHRLIAKGTYDDKVKKRTESKDSNQIYLMKETEKLQRKYGTIRK